MDLPLDQSCARFADLLGDGHFVTGLHQSGQVAFHAVIGNAGQRHTLVVADRSAGKHHIAHCGHGFSIAIEGFVEVAQAEKENAVRVLALELQVLPAHRGCHGFIFVVVFQRFGSDALPAALAPSVFQKTRLLGSP